MTTEEKTAMKQAAHDAAVRAYGRPRTYFERMMLQKAIDSMAVLAFEHIEGLEEEKAEHGRNQYSQGYANGQKDSYT